MLARLEAYFNLEWGEASLNISLDSAHNWGLPDDAVLCWVARCDGPSG